MHNVVRSFASSKLKGLSLLTAAFCCAANAQAKDIIEVDSQGRSTFTGPTVVSVHSGGNSIPDVIEKLINGQDQFQTVAAQNFFDGQVKMLGVADAIHINVDQSNPGAVTARLRTISGLDRTFSGTSRADVESQVHDYLKKEGSAELARLLTYLNATSPLSVVNGNPNSSAALTAQGTFDEYGFPEGRTNAEIEEGSEPTYEIAMRGDIGLIESKGYKAQSYSLPISFSIYEAERWAIRAAIPINYTQIEGAEIYRAGINLAMPIMVIGPTKEHKTPWYWQLTPSGGSQATASMDLIAGGLLNNVSLTSALEYNLGARFHNISISMGNQVTAIESMRLTIGDYSFDPDVSSQILKNGLRVSLPFAQRWIADLYVIDTRFFGGQTYSDGYDTVGGAIGYRRKKGAFFKVGTYANIAKDYTSANVHFGTGWQF